jgi:hypothetical protein
MSTANYRARSATELVDGAVQLLRANLATFVTLGAAFYVPVLIVQWTAMGTMRTPGSVTATAFYGRLAMIWPIFIVWTAVWYTVMFTIVSDLYLGRAGDIGSAINRGLPHLLSTIAASIVKALAVAVGFVFFFIPGIILALYFFAVPAATILEPGGLLASFGRSVTLSRGLKWHVFKTYFIVFCILLAAYVLMLVVGVSLGFIARMISPLATTIVVQVFGALGIVVTYPLWPITTTLLYYDARIRNEGFDLELMSRSVGAAPASAPAY